MDGEQAVDGGVDLGRGVRGGQQLERGGGLREGRYAGASVGGVVGGAAATAGRCQDVDAVGRADLADRPDVRFGAQMEWLVFGRGACARGGGGRGLELDDAAGRVFYDLEQLGRQLQQADILLGMYEGEGDSERGLCGHVMLSMAAFWC